MEKVIKIKSAIIAFMLASLLLGGGYALFSAGVLANDSSATSSDFVTHISQATLLKQQANDDVVIIDVRSAKEFNRGHIPGAILIPHNEILKKPQLLDEFQQNNLVFYCESGVRVKRVTRLLKQQPEWQQHSGKIQHLKGDMKQWRANHMPMQ